MTSKVLAECEKAAGTSQDRGESNSDYFVRVAKVLNKVEDKVFNALSKEAQDWFDAVADAKDKKQDIPAPPEDPEEEPRSRRRSSRDDDDKPAAYVPKKGDRVNVETKRGKKYEDVEFIEIEQTKGGDVFVLKDKDGEFDTPVDGATIAPVKGAEPEEDTSRRRRSSRDEEPEGPAEPKVGDTVEVTNKRGKVYTGILKEDTDDTIVVEVLGGDLEDIIKANITSIKVKHSAGGSGKGDSSKGKDEPKGKEDDGGRRKAASSQTNADGEKVSVTKRMAELVCENMKASEAEIGKMLSGEKLDFKEATLKMNYAATHKVLDILRDRKLLK